MKVLIFSLLAACVLLVVRADECYDIDGNTYSQGDSFSADGCNDCTCGSGGTYACTRKYCADVCLYNGRYYRKDANFQVSCNTCTCGSNGLVSCTQALCGN